MSIVLRTVGIAILSCFVYIETGIATALAIALVLGITEVQHVMLKIINHKSNVNSNNAKNIVEALNRNVEVKVHDE